MTDAGFAQRVAHYRRRYLHTPPPAWLIRTCQWWAAHHPATSNYRPGGPATPPYCPRCGVALPCTSGTDARAVLAALDELVAERRHQRDVIAFEAFVEVLGGSGPGRDSGSES